MIGNEKSAEPPDHQTGLLIDQLPSGYSHKDFNNDQLTYPEHSINMNVESIGPIHWNQQNRMWITLKKCELEL